MSEMLEPTNATRRLNSIVSHISPSLPFVPMGYKKQMFGEDDLRVEIRNGTEVTVYDPFNPVNQLITSSEIEGILCNYGINVPIQHFEFYKRAFVHRSYTKSPLLATHPTDVIIAPQPSDCMNLFTKSNERLEFVGDGILECITKYYLYRRFPKENEGFMTEKKIALVKNEAIGRIAFEMGLHKWFILSKNAEEKQTRTNLKKLGCLFESFLGALFLDFNKIQVSDEDGWFRDVFLTGPGFQMAQKFIENIFEKHIDWIALIQNDDNYKNILQVKIQKEFKVTPHYLEIEHTLDHGYKMGVYLCIGQIVHNFKHSDAIHIDNLKTFKAIHDYIQQHEKIFIYLGEGLHKIKRKAEQIACHEALHKIEGYSN